jgi:hypothetical protein
MRFEFHSSFLFPVEYEGEKSSLLIFPLTTYKVPEIHCLQFITMILIRRYYHSISFSSRVAGDICSSDTTFLQELSK